MSKPLIEADVDFDRGTRRGGLYLVNKGLGPATIDEFTLLGVTVKSDADQMNVRQMLKDRFGPDAFPCCYKLIKTGLMKTDGQIQIGGRYAVLEISDFDPSVSGQEAEWGKLQSLVHDLRITVRYHSILGSADKLTWP